MASTKLVIRAEKANKEGICVIYIIYTHWSQSIYISTGEKIHPKYWDKVKCRIKGSYKGFSTINKVLELKKSKIDELRRQLYLKTGEESVSSVKNEYEDSLKPKKPSNLDFFDFQGEYIEYKEKTQGLANGTIRHIKSFFNRIEDFQRYRKRKVKFESIDEKFYDDLMNYLFDYLEVSPSTAGALIKNLKAYLSYCKKQGYSDNDRYQYFVKPRSSSEPVALDESEFRQLFSANLSSDIHLERVRDLFVFACATGLRYSDFTRVLKSNIQGSILQIKMAKTKKIVRVPLNEYSKFILEKYDYQLPKFSNQNFNKQLKKAAKKAKLNNKRSVTTYKGRVDSTSEVEMNEIISSKTARKSFISMNLVKMSPKIVADLVGHSDLSVTSQYNALNSNSLIEEMQKSEVWKIK